MTSRFWLGIVAALSATLAQGNVITLNFEGIAPRNNNNNVLIQGYYNGGAASNGASGPNYGVEFSAGATLLCLNDLTVQCSNTSKGGGGVAGSGLAAMFFPNANPIMNVAAGFDTGFSMAYGNPFAAQVGVEIWSGVGATGQLLASSSLAATPNGSTACPGYTAEYCPFVNFSLPFAGTARSVRFTGTINRSVYDDFTFGSTTTGGVPEPATLGLTAGAIALMAMLRRRKQQGVHRG